jgi:hypothetical protein
MRRSVSASLLASIVAAATLGSGAACGGGGGGGAARFDVSGAVYLNTFDDDPPGRYTTQNLGADWSSPPFDSGVAAARVTIVAEGGERGNVLRVLYPAGAFGPSGSGAQWRLELGRGFEELFCAYRIRFEPGFDFALEGKLPGLVGGKANVGASVPNGKDGFSARGLWRGAGDAAQLVYHPAQPGAFGEELPWGGARFRPGAWHVVEHRVKMNTAGAPDGIVQAWLDGRMVLDERRFQFRDAPSFAIDALFFSTFFGGDDSRFAPSRSETVDFDDVVVSTTPVTH